MRVLISGLIGAAASSSAWFALQHAKPQANLGWMAILVGLITGWTIHKAAGANAGVGFARGALAVVLSLAAIVGGQKVYAKFMEASNDNAPSVVKAATAAMEDKGGEADAAGDVPAEVPMELEPIEEGQHVGGSGVKKMQIKQIMSEMDFVWMGVAALAAYVVGKGRDPVVATGQINATGQIDEPSPEQDAS